MQRQEHALVMHSNQKVFENGRRRLDRWFRSPTTTRTTRTTSMSTTTTTTLFAGGAWERLEIEDDEDFNWYLISCQVGNELVLLNQCRLACQDLPADVIDRFVVPTTKSLRSHGATRMVTNVKVKYLGFLFAKIRLCKPVYETIQRLDLCRSWVGTVHQKGHKKLPPYPIALDEEEIEKIGLETYQEDEDDDEEEEYNELDSTATSDTTTTEADPADHENGNSSSTVILLDESRSSLESLLGRMGSSAA